MKPGRRHATLRLPSADEVALWRRVAETVEPLPGRRPPPAAEVAAEPAPPPPDSLEEAAPREELDHRARPAAPAAAGTSKLPPLAPIDRRTRARIARGSVPIEDRLDLHGYTQERAHARLKAFIRAAQARGVRLVVIITGKGRGDDGSTLSGERGVLRRLVPQWLAASELRQAVLSIETAHASHGGEGAIYVCLRRRREGQR